MLFALFHGDRHLVGKEIIFDPLSVHHLGPCPALRRTKHDHGPYGTCGIAGLPGLFLNALDAFDHLIHGFCHFPVHLHGFRAFDKIRFPAAAMEIIHELLMAHPCKHRRIRDLVAVQMQDRQHCPIVYGI